MGGTHFYGRAFVVTYTPLVASKAGREASEKHPLPPFIDGSIRREPDLEHELPAITCLCRAEKFAPRLVVGDHVAYVTGKRRYRSLTPHWRLTAVLRVTHLLDGHKTAAEWYRSRSIRLPNNCMVADNPAMPLDHSHRKTIHNGIGTDEQVHRQWDEGYRFRALVSPRVVICEPLFCKLSWDAPTVRDKHWQDSFGGVPGTQNPGARPLSQLQDLMRLLAISAPLSSP
jgi:hypothetical protein